MSGIQDFLNFISKFTRIDFSGREAELGSFVQKYDKDKNSIFDSSELNAIINDFSVFKNDDETEISNVDSFVSHLTSIGRQNKEDIIKKYLDETGNKREFSSEDREYLMQLDNEQLERAGKFLFYVENRDEQFQVNYIPYLAELEDNYFEHAKQLFFVENGSRQLYGDEIWRIAQLEDEDFERAKQLFYIENRDEQFNVTEIERIAQLKDEDFERAKQLFYIENRDEQFNVTEIKRIAQLKDEDFEHAKQLFYVENRNKQFSGKEIEKLAKLEDEDFKWVPKYFNCNNLNSDDIILLAKNHCKELEEYLDLNFSDSYSTKNHFKNLNTDNCLKIKIYSDDDVDKYNTYDKTGIIETTEYQKIQDTESIENGRIITCYNKNLKLEQQKIIGDIPNTDDKNIVFSEVLTYFDDDGNVVRTVTTKRNPENGTLNISEMDKNGKQAPIQWESVDPDTGATITERHLISPDGTKTDCYFEENENLKVSEYKITDKDGNVLINVHQTFEQVSDNKFISSILATDNPEDTQIYEIEYTDDGKVKIFDKENNKITELDSDKFLSYKNNKEREIIIPIIKRLPGQILLKLENTNTTIYDLSVDCRAKGNATASLDYSIGMGDFKNTTNSDENLISFFMHEFGHILDIQRCDFIKFSENPEIKEVYLEESKLLFEYTTTEQQTNIDYLLKYFREITADSHSMLYSKDIPRVNIRRLYLAQYFPRTVAAIMKAMLEEEGVKV